MNFYAMIIVMVLLEMIHYESVSGEIFPDLFEGNVKRLIAALIGLAIIAFLFFFTLQNILTFPKEDKTGIFVFCIFSLIMNCILIFKILRRMK